MNAKDARKRMVGAGGITWACFDPPRWRIDRWVWWLLIKAVPSRWWRSRPRTGLVDLSHADGTKWTVRVLEVRK